MQAEADFLRAALAAPQDDNLRLVYADWLDEQDDPAAAPKAEFLRLLARPTDDTVAARLKDIAATLDTGWAAVVSKLAVENCQKPPPTTGGMRMMFRVVCDRRWEDLTPTDDGGVRHCGGCGENVHFCDTITDAREHADEGHCVAVDLGVIRRDRDLEPPLGMSVVGRPSAEYMRRVEKELEEWSKPDAVSAERIKRKKAETRD